MIDKAITAIKHTGLYLTEMLEWQAFDEVNQTWSDFKAHFVEVYDIQMQSGAGRGNPYHGTAKAYEGVDDDRMGTIMQSMANM